jgi:ATP-dependent RNA helicase RhlE
VHRIGRTGRAGRKGKAISICLNSEIKHLEKIEKLVGSEIKRDKNIFAADRKQSSENAKITSKPELKKKSSKPVDQKIPFKAPEIDKTAKKIIAKETVGMGDHTPSFLKKEIPKFTSK